jgi:hypothetical protein
MNVLHFFQLEYPPDGALHQVGFACSTTGSRPSGAMPRRRGVRSVPCSQEPPSILQRVLELTLPAGFSASLPYVNQSSDIDASTLVGRAVVGLVRGVCPPSAIPVSGAKLEDENLRFNRPGVPLCASGADCVAASLPNAPGPLPVYLSRSEYANKEYPPNGYCLLCIRADAEAVDTVVRRVVQSSTMQLGSAAVCGAPFQNLVNCPDG